MERRRIARPLQPHEITKLSSTLREPARTVFVLGLLTGLRIGELLALRVEALDLTNARLHVRLNVYCGHVGTPKTKDSTRTIPLAVPLLADLHRYLQDTRITAGWLFPSAAGTPLRERNLLRRQVWPACDRLGIPRFGWHSLRHTFSTLGGSNGVPMPTLQSLLGHSSVETTMLYTHPLEAAQREAVNRVATILFPSVPIFTPDTAGGKDLIN
jgi:integrase